MLRVGAATIPTVEISSTIQDGVTAAAAVLSPMLDDDKNVHVQTVDLLFSNITIDYTSLADSPTLIILQVSRSNTASTVFLTNVPDGVKVIWAPMNPTNGPVYGVINGIYFTSGEPYNSVYFATTRLSGTRVLYGSLAVTRSAH